MTDYGIGRHTAKDRNCKSIGRIDNDAFVRDGVTLGLRIDGELRRDRGPRWAGPRTSLEKKPGACATWTVARRRGHLAR